MSGSGGYDSHAGAVPGIVGNDNKSTEAHGHILIQERQRGFTTASFWLGPVNLEDL